MFSTVVEIDEGDVFSLVLENQKLFKDYLIDLNNQINDLDGEIVLSENNKILPIKSKGDEEQGIEKFVRDCVRNLEPDMNYCLCSDKDYLNRMEKLLTKAMGKEPISSSPMSAASAFEFSANSIIVTIF